MRNLRIPPLSGLAAGASELAATTAESPANRAGLQLRFDHPGCGRAGAWAAAPRLAAESAQADFVPS
jgi:hypothetical protein